MSLLLRFPWVPSPRHSILRNVPPTSPQPPAAQIEAQGAWVGLGIRGKGKALTQQFGSCPPTQLMSFFRVRCRVLSPSLPLGRISSRTTYVVLIHSFLGPHSHPPSAVPSGGALCPPGLPNSQHPLLRALIRLYFPNTAWRPQIQ